MAHFKIFTLFPQFFFEAFSSSIIGKALKKNLWSYKAINLRDYAFDKHKTVDDVPFGGGGGMLIKPNIIEEAFLQNGIYHQNYNLNQPNFSSNLGNNSSDLQQNLLPKIIYPSPRGKQFCQEKAIELANYVKNTSLNIICGRYEGIDQRIIDHYQIEEISIGDYILTNGEIAAVVIIDAILRYVENVLGNQQSLEEESFGNGSNSLFANLLEYPHYTRPAIWNNIAVPQILLSGNHQKIKEWRLQQAKEITQKNRPDLIAKFTKNNH